MLDIALTSAGIDEWPSAQKTPGPPHFWVPVCRLIPFSDTRLQNICTSLVDYNIAFHVTFVIPFVTETLLKMVCWDFSVM